jgi:hypothetical protein
MASHFPEPVEIIRNIDPVYWARGGYVYKTTIRLSDGRIVSFYEAMCAGAVTVCDTRPQAFEVLRHGAVLAVSQPAVEPH